ncbi:MAG: ribonuclease H-like domain-containing protein [Peptostreptococcaceae bacterium]|nr:ribonuclease H-like domain-containing protein [Peptostreptococcaceae bacterium]
MDIITKEVDLCLNIDEKTIVLDIETTGLSKINNKIILIGFLYKKNNQVFITQIFCDEKHEENTLINEFFKLISNYKNIITYNGKSFDLPFIETKALKYLKNKSIYDFTHIDLLDFFRKLKKPLNLDSLKLKSIEKLYQINRDDLISGKESVLLYEEYLISKDNNLKNFILLHNFEDILYLSKIECEKFNILKNKNFYFEISINNKDYFLIINNYKFLKNKLRVNLKSLNANIPNLKLYYENINIINKDDNLQVEISITKKEEKIYYPSTHPILLKDCDYVYENVIYSIINSLLTNL